MVSRIKEGSKWLLVYTKAKEEQRAKKNLENQGFEIFLPMIAVAKENQSKSITLKAMFPGYLFVKINTELDKWNRIKSTRGVSHLVVFGQRLAEIPHQVIAYLQSETDENDIFRQKITRQEFTRGDTKSPPPKIYTCSTEPQMLRLGAQFADALQMSDVALPMLDEAMDNIKIGLERREAPAEDFRVGNFWAWHIKEDKEVSYKEARRELIYRGSLLPPYSLHHFLTEDEAQIVIDNWNSGVNNEFLKAYISRSGEIQNVPETLVSTLVSALCSAGDLNDIDRELERFEVFKKAGITDLVIRLFDEPMKGLKMIGERVLPALR